MGKQVSTHDTWFQKIHSLLVHSICFDVQVSVQSMSLHKKQCKDNMAGKPSLKMIELHN